MGLRDWITRKRPDRSVQYEIHRMTHRGGWKRVDPSVYIPEPEPRPTSDDDWWLSWPGRYRHIRRVDGKIDTVLWTYETNDAEEYYEQQRREEQRQAKRHEQREELREMSVEEVEAEYWGETDRLDLLDLGEIGERLDSLRDQRDDSYS